MRPLALGVCLLLVLVAPAVAQEAPPACPCELVLGRASGPNESLRRLDATQDAGLAKIKRLSALIETAGTADASDARLVLAALLRLPEAHVAQLSEQRTRVVVVREGISEYLPDLAGEQPLGWPKGTTFEDVSGAFHPDLNKVLVAVLGHEDGEPYLGREGLTLLHQIGHALDPSSHGGEGSGSTAFRAVHAREAADLSEPLREAGERSASETYAESYARHLTGDEAWFQAMPELHAYWEANPLADYFAVAAPESGADGARTTLWDRARPVISWLAAPEESGPTRYLVHLRDAHGNRWVVGDSVRDAFRREGETVSFSPDNLGLASGERYAWRIEAKSRTKHAFSAWQQVRTAIDLEQQQTLLQGGLPLPFVHARDQAVHVGRDADASPAARRAEGSQGLSGGVR